MPDQERPRVLVVDDNHDNADIIREYLTSLDYPVAVAYDGDEALRLFEEQRPPIVLLDVMMPGRDGWEVCREMKQHTEHGRNVRVIMVTALHDWVDKRQAIQSGADDFIEKPFELAKLGEAVQRNVRRLPAHS
ncbi:MAG TPA: response regulator [Gemmatimonadaceae bacterium]